MTTTTTPDAGPRTRPARPEGPSAHRLRAEHRSARRDHERWMEDLERWRAELRAAFRSFVGRVAPQLELDAFEAALERHEAAIRAHMDMIRRHDRALVQSGAEAESQRRELLPLHLRLGERHGRSAGQHERLARAQGAILAALEILARDAPASG